MMSIIIEIPPSYEKWLNNSTGSLIGWIIRAIMQSLESHKRQIFKKSKNHIEGLQKNITLTETNHPLQKRQSKKLIKHSKFYLIGRKEKQYDLEASNFFDVNDSNYEENLSDHSKGIHIILQRLNPKVTLDMITYS